MGPRFLLAASLLAFSLPAAARDYQSADGKYTICPFRDFDHCDELNPQAMQGERFSGEEKKTLRSLQALTNSTRRITFADLTNTFGTPSLDTDIPGPGNARGTTWLLFPKSDCPWCGIQLVIATDGLGSVNYSVPNKFMIFWFRGPPQPPLLKRPLR